MIGTHPDVALTEQVLDGLPLPLPLPLPTAGQGRRSAVEPLTVGYRRADHLFALHSCVSSPGLDGLLDRCRNGTYVAAATRVG